MGMYQRTQRGPTAGSSGALLAANNLSDVGSSTTARTNLGLGAAAVLPVGAVSGSVAAGDDSRILSSVQTTGTQTVGGAKTFTSPLTLGADVLYSLFDAGNSGTAKTLDLANGSVQKLTLTGNCVITLTAPAAGAFRQLLLYLVQDGSGLRLATWPGAVGWGAVGVPTLSIGANKTDVVRLTTINGGTNWLAQSVGLGF